MLTPYDILNRLFHKINNVKASNTGKIVIDSDNCNMNADFDFNEYLYYILDPHDFKKDEVLNFFEKTAKTDTFFKEICEYLNNISVVKKEREEYPEGVLIKSANNIPIHLNIKKMMDARFVEIPDYIRKIKYTIFLDQAKLNCHEYFKYYEDKPDTYSYAVYHHFNTIAEINNNVESNKDITPLVYTILQSEHHCNIEMIVKIFNDFIVPFSDRIRGAFIYKDDKLQIKLDLFY